MKVYISADIEGVASICHKNETDKSSPDWAKFADQMTYEVACACEGAMEAGATEIVVKDAHWTGLNINHLKLPTGVKLIRGWSGHPYLMMQEIDNTFDACIMVGYHSQAMSGGNPLSHTLSGLRVQSIKINENFASEFLINSFISQSHEVPVVLLTGDYELCRNAKKLNSHITTVESIQGIGNSVLSKHPLETGDDIKKESYYALQKRSECHIILPLKYELEVSFNRPQFAYSASFFPEAELSSPTTVKFRHKKILEIMKFIKFTVCPDL